MWIKFLGQLASVVAMMMMMKRYNTDMAGAVVLMVANMIFLIIGAPVMHTTQGDLMPMPSKKLRAVLSIDAVLAAAAFLAAIAPTPSLQRTVCAAVYTVGAMIGGIEGLVVLGKAK